MIGHAGRFDLEQMYDPGGGDEASALIGHAGVEPGVHGGAHTRERIGCLAVGTAPP